MQMESDSAKMPTVSVVVPTADRRELLLDALRCVLRQSSTVLEILVIDNGISPIDAESLPAGVTVIRTAPRIGPGRARNIGVTAASGEFVAFLDDDDLWEIDYIKWVRESIKDGNVQIILAKLMRSRADGKLEDYKTITEDPRNLRRVFYSNPGVVGSNITVNRRFFIDVSGFDESMPSSEDRDLLARALVLGACVVSQPQAVAVLRDHSGTRAHHNIVLGNWKFIRKHWRNMRIRELGLAIRVLLIRVMCAGS